MFYLEANYKVLDGARQSKDGLFYIEEQQDGKSQAESDTRVHEKAMMATVRHEAAQKQPR